MLFEDLKKAKIDAIKAHNKEHADIIGILVNKAMLVKIEKRAKNEELTDADVLQLLTKTIKELDEEINAFEKANRLEKVEVLKKQKEVLKAYQPQMLTDEEIVKEINSLEDKSMPVVMKHFKVNFTGRVDMRKVQEVLKGLN